MSFFNNKNNNNNNNNNFKKMKDLHEMMLTKKEARQETETARPRQPARPGCIASDAKEKAILPP